MKTSAVDLFSTNQLVKLREDDWLEKQRVAGKVVSQCLSFLEREVLNLTTKTALKLSKEADDFIQDHGCIATFKNYKGFPEAICVSVNNELVHGIPKDKRFEERDVISFDLGATYQGAIADSALTVGFGETKYQHMIDANEEALFKAISAIAIGKRVGSIGNAIYKSAKGNGFDVIGTYGGHGITTDIEGNGVPHGAPFIGNKTLPTEGIRIQPGLTIAIEPLLVSIGDTTTKIDKDGWTVCTKYVSCHIEHTIFIHKDRVEIISYRETEKYLKSNEVFFEA